MLCALTVRKLKPGTFDEFRSRFGPQDEAPPEGWSAFHMLRSTSDDTEVVTFGFFDGTPEELESNQAEHGYRQRVDDVTPLVESVLVNGLYVCEIAVQATTAR